MKKRLLFAVVFLSSVIISRRASADEPRYFPPAHEIFAPLRADPRELQYALRLVTPVQHRVIGEAAIGDYIGIYRWKTAGGTRFQVNGGGGFFGRFDLSGRSNDMISADFFGNLPLDWRKERWSGRFMLYHSSSHLGDDYLKSRGVVTTKHSWDNLRWIVSYEPTSPWRLYSGYIYTFRTLPQHIGRNALQGGVEWQSTLSADGHFRYYAAGDYQAWERAAWKPMLNIQAGVKCGDRVSNRAFTLFTEWGAGRQPQGQFYSQKETHWTLGVKFDLS